MNVLVALVIGAVFFRISRKMVLNPVSELANAVSDISRGDLSRTVRVETTGEVQVLVDGFNQMISNLKEMTVSKGYVDSIIEGMIDALIVVSPDGRISRTNAAADRLLGYEKRVLLNLPVQQILSPDSSLQMEEFEGVLTGHPITDREAILTTRDGSEIMVRFSASVIRDSNDTITDVVCVAQDITVRKRAEESLRKSKEAADAASRTKSEFLANMSHELRTPLNAIIGFSELLEDEYIGDLNDQQKEYVKNIHVSGLHLLSVITDILDLSKVEAGKLELQLTEIKLKTVLDECLNLFRDKAMELDILLLMDIEDGIEGIRTDRRIFKQVVFNLLSNAIKFTAGGGKVRLSACALKKMDGRWLSKDGEVIILPISEDHGNEDKNYAVVISVADTGIGLKKEDSERIFNPFEQVDGSKSRRYEGTGLGLSLSRRFVRLHGGEIWAESEGENKGSVFHFVIPF